MEKRPEWTTYFLEIAKLIGTRSTCPRARVGAVLVKGNRIISTGYNGSLPGTPHCTEVGCQMEDGHCQRAIHAEVNAVAQAAKYGIATEGASIYIFDTLQRDICRECRKVILAAGITITIKE